MERTRFLLSITFLLVHFCSMGSLTMTAQTNISTDQSALFALKARITNDPQNMIFSKWSTTTTVCNWVGVTCGKRHHRVTALDLSYFGLTGTIPPELGNLSFLVELYLRNNSFHGTFPEELARLRRLKLINLGWNNFMGAIPSWFGSLFKLETFNLFGNQFSGPIPAAIFNLSSLQVFNLSFNQLSGTIPPEIGNLSFLNELRFTNNSFQGSLPQELARMRRLKYISLGFNKFTGIIPTWFGSFSKLQHLYLYNNKFSGSIPTTIFNLSALEVIALRYNQLSGSIPREIGNLTMLKVLNLDNNNFIEIPKEVGTLNLLENLLVQNCALKGPIPVNVFNMSSLSILSLSENSLNGSLPDNICQHLPNIKMFQLTGNQLGGPLPSQFWQCKELQVLSLSVNNFSGSIPRNIGNLTQLQELYLGYNNLTGTIPHEIGDLQNLEILALQDNIFFGLIPSTIFNMSLVTELTFTNNQLSDTLTANTGNGVPNLQHLFLSNNYLVGQIPKFISNASKLIDIDVGGNFFSGFIPSTLCSLANLQWLNLGDNNLTIDTSTPKANMFSNCLANLTNLRTLSLSYNSLNVMFPVSIGNNSTSLQSLLLINCSIKGSIPSDVGNLNNLTVLDLGYNQLSGSIPASIGRLRNLQGLYLSNNRLQKYIPDEVCQLSNLVDLSLGVNQLSGSIPSCLDLLAASLRTLSLGTNLLTSTIPSTLWALADILLLDLSSNSLVGSIPEGLGNLKVVRGIDLSNNLLIGIIPSSIGRLQDMVNLSLANNNLEGSIPASLGTLLSLELLDLSKNNLSGLIPKSLEALIYLTHMNLSFNKLQGEVPIGGPFQNFSAQSFVSNGELCGAPRLHLPPCKRIANNSILKYIIPGVLSAMLLVIFLWILILRRKRNVAASPETPLLSQLWRKVSYLQLLRATNGFSESNLLGTGSFGSVYKGTLSDGIDVAIKVFNLQLEEAFKSFDIECQMLGNIRHRNLVKVISCCSQTDFKAVVLNYMPNGSLDKWLYSHEFSLNIFQRLNIMIDVASALEYLHHGYETHIVHCDLKPNNILLDDDMVAHVADFGVAKLIGGEDSMTRTMTLATVGYMAPEYGIEGIVTTRGDVYSFGIVLMETFTKKKPTDEMFVGGRNLKQWVADSLLADAIVQVVDANLLGTQEDQESVSKRNCFSSIMRLALACCAESLEERINMQDALATLNKIKIKFFKDAAGDEVQRRIQSKDG